MIKQVQLYDDHLDFEDNKARGPFGDYADKTQRYQDQGEPTYDFFGTPVYSPFGIAAGPLPTTQFIDAALAKGFDIVTLKSVRTSVFPLNKYPQVRPVALTHDLDPASTEPVQVADAYSEPLAAANSFGIPSVSPEQWQPYVRESMQLPAKGQALLIALQGTARGTGRDDFVQDHVRGVELILETGYEGIIEINLSCPNEPEIDASGNPVCYPGGSRATMACFDEDMTVRIVEAVREANPDLKFMIKLAYFSNHQQLRDLVEKVGDKLDGISAINTIPFDVVNAQGKEVFPGRPKAGISGAPVKWAGLEMTKLLKQYREEFGYAYKIVGMGGVLNAADFNEYLAAGADHVMSVTGAMWNPDLAAEIKASLTSQ